jgi:arylsulfatase
MQDLFMKEAVKHRVLPIDDRSVERVNAKLAGRPDLMGDRTSLTLHAGMKGMSENVFLNVKNRSLPITADVESPAGGANGVIIAQGGRFGGWSLYFKNGKPVYTYNFLGLQRFTVASAQAVPAGRATIRLEFAYDGGGLGKGGLATIYANDKKLAEGRIERTQPMIFSADETADVGEDDATPVTEDYKAYDNKFTGKILKVTVDVKDLGAGEKAEAGKANAEAVKKIDAAK